MWPQGTALLPGRLGGRERMEDWLTAGLEQQGWAAALITSSIMATDELMP